MIINDFKIMKRLYLLLLILSEICVGASAAPVWHDASEFPVYGKISDATNNRYERLPGYLEGKCRKPVWNLGRNSAGLYIRFKAETMAVYVRWTPLFDNHMNHMTDTGIKGLDLYALSDENGWRFYRSARPTGKENEVRLVVGRQEREFMLYLPLYDGLASLEIGVDEDGSIMQPEIESPLTSKPIIMYGSSILQGGCASRPGMAHTNILSRRLDREVINLGFSGNGLLDYEIAELMASHKDPGLFVLDYVPNPTAEVIEAKGERFFRILRDAHPDVPVVFVELPNGPTMLFDKGAERIFTQKNAAQRQLYEKLKKAGEKKIHYVETGDMIGSDGEATVDGTHFTDLGMIRYVDHILPVIMKALK